MSLSKDKILAAAREVIRRHGPSKATVVDVALALGVSHGSIYRFFPTKSALREAVVADWLGEIVAALPSPATGLALDQLRGWFEVFWTIKKAQRDQSPELFEAFRELSAQEPQVLAAYKGQLVAQIAGFLQLGLDTGEFRPLEAEATARAFLNATLRFHHPSFARDWEAPATRADFDTLWDLLARSIASEGTPS